MGDDTEPGNQDIEAGRNLGCAYGIRGDGAADGNRGTAQEGIHL